MDRLEMAIELIREALEEKKRFAQYESEMSKLRYSRLDPDYWCKRNEIDAKYSPIPRKAVINDNLKIARRLLLKEYMKG